MNQNRIYSIVAVCVVCSILAGCAGAVLAGAAGAGSIAYIRGELKSVESASIDRVWAATLEASNEMGFTIVERDKDALTGRVKAVGAQKDIYINIKSLGDRTTEIRIRIGVFGDETMSRRILDEIRDNLI